MRRAATIALALLAGCVPRFAGYDEVKGIVNDRAGADLRWHAADAASGEDIEKLLEEPLNARSAVAVALLGNPELQAAFEDLGVAAGDLQAALALPNPRVQTGVHFLRGRDPQFDIEVMLSVSQLIFMPLRKDAAKSEQEAVKLAVAGKALDLILEVRRRFVAHQAAMQTLELQRVALAASRAAWETARQLQEAGNIVDLRAATEKADYEEARLSVAAAELAVELSRERLGALLGLWGDTRWSIEPTVPALSGGEPEVAKLESEALRRSLDLRMAEHRHAAAAQRADIATATGWLPDLSLGVEVQREEEGWEIGPEVELEVPLFYQNQGERASAEASMRRQKQRHRAIAIQIRAAARAAAARLVAARDRVRFYEEVLLPMRQTVLEETQLQYNAMATSAFELLRAKRTQVDAQRSHVEALRDYWIARAEVEQLIAGRLVQNDAMPTGPTDTALPAADH